MTTKQLPRVTYIFHVTFDYPDMREEGGKKSASIFGTSKGEKVRRKEGVEWLEMEKPKQKRKSQIDCHYQEEEEEEETVL